MESPNVIVIPPHYRGTSFDEMTRALSISARGSGLPIDLIGQTEPLTNDLTGELLDDERYIQGQIAVIAEITRRKNAAKILFLDFFNPGLDILRYAHLQRNTESKYGSILSGGSFLKDDLYSFDWLRSYELAWAHTYDSIYTPSPHIASHLPEPLKAKTKFLPHGMDAFTPVVSDEKKYDVVFPHRLNSDKGVDDLIKIAKGLNDASIAVPVPHGSELNDKNRYHDSLSELGNVTLLNAQNDSEHAKTLGSSKVVLSCAKQELFGYSVMKSVLSGCAPVLPNNQCYPHFFPKDFLYDSNAEAIDMIKRNLDETGLEKSPALEEIRERIRNFTFKDILKDFFSGD